MKALSNILLLILVISLCLVSFSAYKRHTETEQVKILAEQNQRAYEAEGFLWQAYSNRRDDETFFLKYFLNSEVKDGKLDIYLYGSTIGLYSEVEKLFKEFMSEYSDVIRVYSHSNEELHEIGSELLDIFIEEIPIDLSEFSENQLYFQSCSVDENGCIKIDYLNEKYSYKAQKMAAEYSEKYNVRIVVDT